MTTQVRDLTVYLGAVAGLCALYGLAGFGVLSIAVGRTSRWQYALSVPFGLAVLIPIGAGLAVFTGRPIGTLMALIAGMLALTGAVQVIRHERQRRPEQVTGIRYAFVCALFTLGFLAYTFRELWGQGRLATVSWNNDILYYAYVARHAAELGLAHPSWISGYDISANISTDVPGSVTALALPGRILGDTLHATLPFMAVLVVATAMSAFVLLRRAIGLGPLAAAIGGVLTTASYAFVYDSYQYFMGERISVALLLFSLAWIATDSRMRSVIAMQAVVTAALWVSYEQTMVYQIPLAIVFILVMQAKRRRLRLSSACPGVRGVLGLGIGVAVGTIIWGPMLPDRITHVRSLLGSPAGWPMPTTSLFESIGMLGIQNQPNAAETAVLECAVLIVTLGVLGMATRPKGPYDAVMGIALLLPYAAYLRFATEEPGSYRQWKAMAFATPTLTLACVVALFLGVSAVGRWRATWRPWLAPAVPIALALALLLAMKHSYDPSRDIRACSWPLLCPINDQARTKFDRINAELGPAPVNADLGWFWPSMTAAYLLWGRPIGIPTTTYFPNSVIPSARVITPADLNE